MTHGPFQTYKSDTAVLLGLNVTIYVAFIRRRLVLFAAEGKTPEGIFPFEYDSEDNLGVVVHTSGSEDEEPTESLESQLSLMLPL